MTQASNDSPASTNPARSENNRSGHTVWRASTARSYPSWTRQITAGSIRGNSSWPLTGLTRDQPPLIGFVGDPSTALNRALSCQFSSAVAVATN